MHILPLPPPTSQPPPPFGRRQELGSNLAKFPHQFSPARSEQQHSYPSPPMSDSHSPARRSAQIVEPKGHPYPPPVSESRRTGTLVPLPPPPQSLYDPRSATSGQGHSHQRPLYPGEPQSAAQMLHYQGGRAIEPPSYGGMHVAHNYAYGYPSVSLPSHIGGYGPGPQGQPTAIIPPPPMRPSKPARRTKAHVASACVNCKKAHLSCDVQRPCGRCVASGKQDSCKDVQHKKRGRPRLRDDKEFGRGDDGRPTHTHLLGAPPALGSDQFAQQPPAFPSSHRATDPLRVVGRQARGSDDSSNTRLQSISSSAGGTPTSAGGYGGALYGSGPNMAYQSLPVAFLNLDLVVLKSNQAFQDLVAFLGDVRGKSLSDLLESRQVDVLHRVRNELRDERDEREPAYMAPITPLGQDPVQSIAERDVDHVSQGFVDRPFILNFKLPNGHYQSLQTQIRLAKTSLYFVTLVVHTPSRPVGPPLLTQHLAPPTPIRASQTLSAPTTAPTRDFGPYSARPSSSASSAPTSPYFNFSSVRTSLPTISSSSYGNSPSYNYSPTAGPEQGYLSTIQPLAQPASGYPSPYPPLSSRTGSGTSEPLRELNRPTRLEGLQLPPIRTGPAPLLASPLSHDLSETTPERAHNMRRREPSPPSAATNPETPETGKRRRLNIHEVLE
ncbi:hypothetical protein K504DRAFT_385630 [Pleomassaria siparia CBS 279.74]|uniref:Zn(2)-C6 fungal-type domain-containing protein n=1 Tax=Pleomassaria siparia CBS 279.74 TaxID=1314801 RepID=A0A6G1K1A5_9PLEO|nr:hypothetical protein K504DRAFT_385630 [Pleomassaria siparia CBS 279.74]